MLVALIALADVGINWLGVGGFVITLLIQAAAFSWLLAQIKFGLERVQADFADHKPLPDRVSKLEFRTDQHGLALTELKEVTHKINSKLQELNLVLASIDGKLDK
jgi:hypothetical protein